MSGHFAFLQHEWPSVFEAAGKAETAVHADPRTACFYARCALELAVAWAYTRKKGLDRETNKALLLKHIQDNASTGAQMEEFRQVCV